MTILAFNDGNKEVVTTAWTAYGKDTIDIAYVWGADSLSFFSGATGVSRFGFAMTMSEFLSYRKNGMIDLR